MMTNGLMIDNYELVLIKVGTTTIIEKSELNKEFLTLLVHEAGQLIKKGKKVIIVSSGAIGLGKKRLHFEPVHVPEQQGFAAIGQVILMQEYQKRFDNIGIETAQILLSQHDLQNDSGLTNIKNAFDFLFKHSAVAIVNENDVVATEELRKNGTFSDNDALAALLATKLHANLLVLLTEKGGLIGKSGEILEEFHTTADLAPLKDSIGGRGGIDSKIKAIEETTSSGCDVFVSGNNGLRGLSEGKAIGTLARTSAK